MTRRERLERRLEKRREWAESRRAKGEAAYEKSAGIIGNIPMGQPILIGHHSEKRHRADLERADNAMRKSVECSAMAKHHESKADGIESILDSAVFSDDEGAVDKLKERIKELEETRATMVAINKAYRKCGCPGPENAEGWTKIEAELAAQGITASGVAMANRMHKSRQWGQGRKPFETYQLSNLGGRIQAAKKRIAHIQAMDARKAEAEAAGGLTIKIHESINWATVTFAEKPERAIINALKDAGFRWGGGSWSGYADKLPEAVKSLGVS